MDEDRVREIVNAMVFSNGKKDMGLGEIAQSLPGLARIMPEIGARTWKLYYAGKALNWANAMYQWKEGKKLFEVCSLMRPKHQPAIERYLRLDWAELETAIRAEDLDAFLAVFDKIVDSANDWHVRKGKPYIVWKVPDHAPPDLDFEPRE